MDEEPRVDADRTEGNAAGAGAGDLLASLSLPADAAPDEAAAIAAAVGAHLDARAAETEEEADHPWAGHEWAFAGRVERLAGRALRIHSGAPPDAWSAAGRIDRM